MTSNTPPSQSSGRERREYYRVTVLLPLSIGPESDTAERPLVEQSVNLSGGGLGVIVHTAYNPNDVLSVTLLLPEHGRFTTSIEVLWLDPLPVPGNMYRLHARFIRLSSQDRDLLIRHILWFQRDHLTRHYLA